MTARTPGSQSAPPETVAAGDGPDAAEWHLRGRIVSASHEIDDGVVTVRGELIAAVAPFPHWRADHPDAPAPPWRGTLVPGLVDIHNHGGFGHRFDTTDADEARSAARHHHREGSTSVLASVVTGAPDDMVSQTAALRGAVLDGAVAGIHLEGPFLSEKRCGAQDPRWLTDPDPALLERLLAAGEGAVRMMTLAPELSGFAAAADLLDERDVVVALGHSDATSAQFRSALSPDGVATVVTHLANGMPPLHHRSPGPVAASLVAAADRCATVELIGDGVHVAPDFGALVFATAPGAVALITDAMQAAGLPDGTYRLGPQQVRVCDGIARVANGSIAGGTATLLRCLRWVVRECRVPLLEAVRAATATPAAAVGLDGVGDLRPRLFADVLVLDDDLGLHRVLRRGQWLR